MAKTTLDEPRFTAQHCVKRLSALHPHPRNPRRITPARLAQLAQAMAADPEMLEARPVIALPDGTVIAGNQRLAAARELGWESIRTVVVDLDEQRALEWALRDNQAYGEWDDAGVTQLLADLEQRGGDLALTGFDEESISRLLDALDQDGDVDVDEAPELPSDPESRIGEIYELGNHRLACGDATHPEVLAELMQGEPAQVILTDPPYGVDYDGGTKRQRRLLGDEDASIYERFLPAAALHADEKAPLYLWHADACQRQVLEAIRVAGYATRALIVWSKNQAQFGNAAAVHYKQKHEPCWYATKRGKTPRWYGPANEVTVWEHNRARSNDLHPTQKPVDLFERAIRNSTLRGDLVLDPFAGSGTTLAACELLGRHARLVELDPAYCDVIRQRYAALAESAHAAA